MLARVKKDDREVKRTHRGTLIEGLSGAWGPALHVMQPYLQTAFRGPGGQTPHPLFFGVPPRQAVGCSLEIQAAVYSVAINMELTSFHHDKWQGQALLSSSECSLNCFLHVWPVGEAALRK